MDDGSIFVGKVEKNLEYLKLEELLTLKVHDARIMGIDFDEAGSSVYTVSEDKCLKVTEISEHKIVFSNVYFCFLFIYKIISIRLCY